MRARLFVRMLSEAERTELKRKLRSADSFVLRRSQVILFSAAGLSITEISERVGYHAEWVRRIIHRFNREGLAGLERRKRGRRQVVRVFKEDGKAALEDIIHHSPRAYGKETSLWTLALLAEVCHERGLASRRLSAEGMRQVLKRYGIRWKRAKRWLVSPDPQYELKKNGETA